MSLALKKINGILIFAFLLLVSCEGDIYLKYHFSGLEIENADNSGEWPVVSSADSIRKEAYVLRLNLFPVEESRNGRYLDPETPPINSNPIDSISIFSGTKFNDTLPAGSRLNSVFRIFNRSYWHVYPIDDFKIANVYNSDFMDEPVPEYVDILLIIPPDSIRNYEFYVFMKLRDGTIFLDSTEIIKLY